MSRAGKGEGKPGAMARLPSQDLKVDIFTNNPPPPAVSLLGAMMAPNDDDLIASYRAGSQDAFEVLYSRYEAPLFGFLLSLGGTREQAEDTFQGAWMEVIRHMDVYQPRGRFQSWLFRIAHRKWLDLVRSRWHRSRVVAECVEDWESLPIDQAYLASLPDPRAQAAAAEESARLREALEQLPDLMRQAVLLRIDGEMTYQEIADTMGCPLGTALWRVRAAEARIHEALRGEEVSQ